jgi:hypothetical protein
VAWSRDEAERQAQEAASTYAARIRAIGFDPVLALAMVKASLQSH